MMLPFAVLTLAFIACATARVRRRQLSRRVTRDHLELVAHQRFMTAMRDSEATT